MTGRFDRDGRGVFEGDDTHDGKDVRVRFVWSGISVTTAHWEQFFSVDGGDTCCRTGRWRSPVAPDPPSVDAAH
ncbi:MULTISPECIES: hypothetical protein [Streptomyces]|uniref:hypothetical protein n=1 Tax=Streptomyces TaxID=1883 RepID=UPI002DD7E2AB|nr:MULTISPECIES: hypothetical protein [unclassified Streptomyces]WSD95121.1 hypothetical protein OG758_13925 [Streptomyces sp. NBC_01474]